MNCGRCRAALQGQRFCTACGAPSGSGARQGTVGGGAACQRCRQPSLDGAKFCTG
ncbi:hypothetical protein T484DRAFT_2622122 [Baffinella frigidus]|nr:hypothetical protein T484DRAFT_2622122 [Cryptophyta sp. CCMP2293]